MSLMPAILLHAEEENGEFSPNLYVGTLYDSNVFRLPDSQESTTIYQYGGGLDVTLPVSQQFFDLSATAVRNHFDGDSSLDYTYVGSLARWRWRFGNLWDGDVGWRYRQDIAPFDELQAPVRDLRRFNSVGASANRRLSLRWMASLTAGHDWMRHDLGSRHQLDRDVDRGSAEIRLLGTGESASYVGLGATLRQVDFPSREVVAATLVDNSYEEREIDVNYKWEASRASVLSGQAGYTTLEHDQFSERDFSGPVGSLSYHYQPVETLGVELSAWRNLSVWTETTASYMTEVGFGIRPSWQAGARLSFEGSLSVLRHRFEGDPLVTVTSTPIRRDNIDAAEISAIYAQYENLHYTLVLHSERRNSNRDAKDYRYHSIAANIKVDF